MRRLREALQDEAAVGAARRGPLRQEAPRVRTVPKDVRQEGQTQGTHKVRVGLRNFVWGILTPYPEAEWVFSPESIMPPRPIGP